MMEKKSFWSPPLFGWQYLLVRDDIYPNFWKYEFDNLIIAIEEYRLSRDGYHSVHVFIGSGPNQSSFKSSGTHHISTFKRVEESIQSYLQDAKRVKNSLGV
jgi:hypothetical protein